MTKVSIAFAGSAGLGGFPDFPVSLGQQLQEEFPAASVRLLSDPAQRRTELADSREAIGAIVYGSKACIVLAAF